MPGTASFDLYDTVLVRPVLDPHDVFRHIENQQHAPGWTSARIAAESIARRRSASGEVTLDDIYAAAPLVPWQPALSALQQAELLWETWTRICPAAATHIAAARAAGKQIVFVTDMYLPRALIRSLLTPIWRDTDRLFISHEAGDSKGRTWWSSLSKSLEAPCTHLGDHPNSDVRCPRAHGIDATLWTLSRLSTVESALAASNPRPHLGVGAARLARLLRPDEANGFWDDGANVTGPLLHGFVSWILRKARAEGVERIFFLARDGQLPWRMASRLRAMDPSLPEPVYLYGSRQAWYRAVFDPRDERHRRWVAHAYPPTFDAVLANLGVDPADLEPILQRLGVAAESRSIPTSARENWRLLRRLAEDAEWCAFFDALTAQHTAMVHAYFTQLGVFSAPKIALVDIGWSGSMLEAFKDLVRRSRSKPPVIIGYFFGLHQNIGPDRHTYAFAPSIWPHWLTAFPSIVEMLTPADHGQTCGYAPNRAGQIEPVLANDRVAPAADIAALQNGALQYLEEALKLEAPPPDCDAALRAFLINPSPEVIARWQRFRFWTWQNPNEAESPSLITRLPGPQLVRRLLSPWRACDEWPWPTAVLRERWPYLPATVLRLFSFKLQCDRLCLGIVLTLGGLGVRGIRRLRRMS